MKIVFYGGDSQTGTTMLALSCGQLLAERGYRLLYIDASGNPGSDFLSLTGGAGLDDLRPALEEEDFDGRMLGQWIQPCRGMDILRGIRSLHGADRFRDTHVKRLCEAAETRYALVLLDGGCGSHFLSQSALRAADGLVLAVTQQEKCLRRTRARLAAEGENLPEKRILTVNKYHSSGAFYRQEEVAEQLGWYGEPVFSVPFTAYGWQAEQERTTLLKYRSFRRACSRLSDGLEAWLKTGQKGGADDGI